MLGWGQRLSLTSCLLGSWWAQKAGTSGSGRAPRAPGHATTSHQGPHRHSQPGEGQALGTSVLPGLWAWATLP